MANTTNAETQAYFGVSYNTQQNVYDNAAVGLQAAVDAGPSLGGGVVGPGAESDMPPTKIGKTTILAVTTAWSSLPLTVGRRYCALASDTVRLSQGGVAAPTGETFELSTMTYFVFRVERLGEAVLWLRAPSGPATVKVTDLTTVPSA